MKKIFALGWMLVAALALTNCSKEEAVAPEMEGQAFELFANAGGSRTTMADLKTSWVANDAMNVWTATADGYQSHGKFTVSDVENGKFTGTLDASFDNTTANDWYVMYPYDANIKLPDGSNYMYVGHTLPKQNGNNSQAHLSGSAAPLYSVAKNVAGSETPVFQMHHLSTFVRVRVKNNTEAPFSVASIYLTSENEFYLAGSYYVNITGEEVEYVPSGGTYTKSEVTLTVNNGEEIAVGKQAEFYLPLAPIQFGANDEMLTVNITTTEGATISVEKTIPGGTKFAAGKLNTLNAVATVDNTEYPEVATDTWTLLEDPSEMVEGQYIIVAKYGDGISYLPSTTNTSSAPKYTETELFDLTSRNLELETTEMMVWNFAHDSNNPSNWAITNAEGAYLYCTDTNNGIRVGNTPDAWSIDSYPTNKTAFRFKNDNLNRYVGIYNKQDWRCYSTYNHSNYGTSSQIYLYYKGTVVAKTALATPENLTATVQNETEVVVSWDAVENAGSYIVTCGANTATVTDATTYTFTDLEESTTYSVSVVAVPSNTETYKNSDAATTSVQTGGAISYASIYTSNVALTTIGATKGSTASVTIDGQKYDALKAGTSSVAGSIVVTVPAGTTKLHYHVVAWNGKTTKITVKQGSTNLANHSIRAEAGVAGNSNDFTISTEAGDYYSVDLTDITTDTAITFAATTSNRFVIWGVNAQ